MDVKELAKLVDLCRKKGIAELKLDKDMVELKLWDHIPTQRRKRLNKVIADAMDPIITENEPTEEELLFWSSPTTDTAKGSN